MQIETENCIYDIGFQHCQIEVTGICNMRCKHCRAWEEARVDLSMADINNVLDFFVSQKRGEQRVTVSGGEPFLNKNIISIIKLIYHKGIKNIIITTNASVVTEDLLVQLENLNIPNLSIQVSLDSYIEKEHDEFRGYSGAYKKAIELLKRCAVSPYLISSMRVSVTPDRIKEIANMVNLASELGCQRIGIGSVIPVGRASDTKLCMNAMQKKEFITEISRLRKQYGDMDITTEDPLKFACDDFVTWNLGEGIDIYSESTIGGCTAGITGFNVSSDGFITPCAVFLENVTNICGKTPEEIALEYEKSDIIKTLLTRNLNGKCGQCDLRRICGGCRATAHGISGSYRDADPTCWRIPHIIDK